MQILVDDHSYQPAGGADQTVQELALEVVAAAAGSPRMVVALRCDGSDIDEQRLTEVLAANVGSFDSVEIITQPVAALVKATLDQAIAVFDDASRSRGAIADALAEGRVNDAMESLQTLLNTWRQVQEALVGAAEGLELTLDDLSVEDHPLTELVAMIRTHLTELKDAMTDGDFVLLGDVVRYELEEPFRLWGQLLRQLRGLAEERSR